MIDVFTLVKKRNWNPLPFFLVHIEIKHPHPPLDFVVDLVPVHSGSILSLVSLCVISFGTSLCLQRLSVVCRKGNAAMISFPVFT